MENEKQTTISAQVVIDSNKLSFTLAKPRQESNKILLGLRKEREVLSNIIHETIGEIEENVTEKVNRTGTD